LDLGRTGKTAIDDDDFAGHEPITVGKIEHDLTNVIRGGDAI
jgi:hypothetical protein